MRGMNIKDLTLMFEWLDSGQYTTTDIAEFTGINPNLIDSIVEIYEAKVDLELYA